MTRSGDDMTSGTEIHVDRQQPPALTFADTGGEPIRSYLPDDGGWVLHVQHYRPFRMDVAEFDKVDEAQSKARERLRGKLPDVDLLEIGRVSLRSERGERGGSRYFSSLTAALRENGSLSVFGHDVGATEYEYWYTIKSEDIPALVVALGGTPVDGILDVLKENWSGDAALGLGPAIRNSGINYDFFAHY